MSEQGWWVLRNNLRNPAQLRGGACLYVTNGKLSSWRVCPLVPSRDLDLERC